MTTYAPEDYKIQLLPVIFIFQLNYFPFSPLDEEKATGNKITPSPLALICIYLNNLTNISNKTLMKTIFFVIGVKVDAV